MEDVARAAGVSVATVSKVVNQRYGVAQSTMDKVTEVIESLGYEASLGARSLRSHRTNVIGVLVAEFEPFSTELLKGVSSAIDETGYELLAYSGGHHGRSVGWERRSLSRLGGTLIDGAILVTPTVVSAPAEIPVVAVDPHTGPAGFPTVDADNAAGAVAATEHLLALGHRRIALLGGREDLESARLREQGFRHAMAAAGVPVDPELVRVGGYRPETASAPAHELLSLPDRPTAVFAANDISAIRTIEVAHELGLRVPQDVSVVGFDNVPESVLCDPSLTTVAQPLHDIGATAVRMLVELLAGREPTPGHVCLPTRLVVRDSTGPVGILIDPARRTVWRRRGLTSRYGPMVLVDRGKKPHRPAESRARARQNRVLPSVAGQRNRSAISGTVSRMVCSVTLPKPRTSWGGLVAPSDRWLLMPYSATPRARAPATTSASERWSGRCATAWNPASSPESRTLGACAASVWTRVIRRAA